MGNNLRYPFSEGSGRVRPRTPAGVRPDVEGGTKRIHLKGLVLVKMAALGFRERFSARSNKFSKKLKSCGLSSKLSFAFMIYISYD